MFKTIVKTTILNKPKCSIRKTDLKKHSGANQFLFLGGRTCKLEFAVNLLSKGWSIETQIDQSQMSKQIKKWGSFYYLEKVYGEVILAMSQNFGTI